MKKLFSVLLSLVMTVTLCLGFGQTAVAVEDYDTQITKLEKQIKEYEDKLDWYTSHADSTEGCQYTGASQVVMSSPFIIKTPGFPLGSISSGYIRITNPSYSSDHYNASLLGTYYSSYVKPLGTYTYSYNGTSVPNYEFVDIETYAPEIHKLKEAIENGKYKLENLKEVRDAYNQVSKDMKKSDFFVYLGSDGEYQKITELELSRKLSVELQVGYYDSNGDICNCIILETFKWKSADSKIAKVNSYGLVTGVKQGTTTITGTGRESGKKVTLTVKVNQNPTKNIKLAKESFSISCGKVYTMKYAIDEGSNDVVHFYSSNDNVAWVTDNGKVHSVHSGTAYIAAYTKNGAKAYCKVTVTNKNAPKEDNVYKAVKAAEKYHTNRIDPEGMAEYIVYSIYVNKKTIKVSVFNFEDEIELQTMNWESNLEYNDYINSTAEYTYSISKKAITQKAMREFGNDMYTYKGEYCKAKYIEISTGLGRNESPKVGTTAQMKIKITGRSYGEKSTWTSSDKSVAEVSSSGEVSFKAPGTVTITCKMEGGATDSVTFTVADPDAKKDEQPEPQDDTDDYECTTEESDDYYGYTTEESDDYYEW